MSNNIGVGFFGLLAIAFIVLKLTGFIAWPWVWVLSPLLVGFAFVIIMFLVLLSVLYMNIKDK